VPLPANGATYGHSSGLTVTVTGAVSGGPVPVGAVIDFAAGAGSQNQIAP
jgi:hypothetical protein